MSPRPWLSGLSALIVPTALLLTAGCAAQQAAAPEAPQQPEPAGEPQPFWVDLEPETLLERAPGWMLRGEQLIASGDSTAADETMMDAIQALQHVARDLPETPRGMLLDTLEEWTSRWRGHFDPMVTDLVASEDGIEPVLTPDRGSLSLYEELLLDSFVVVLDPTVTEDEVLDAIPDTTTARVQRMIDYFTTSERGRTAMRIWLERAGEMIPRMVPVLRAHGVPEDLVYLSMIESGFRTDARSWAKAVGPWQFIYSTGKTFGLEMDWWYDERRDPELAAASAARFLRQLREHLGDWYLALAAYNCGEGRVWRDIRRNNSRDFWQLASLPRQTRNYVPTFLAARRIAKDPEQYGFQRPSWVRVAERDTVIVREAVELRALAEALEVDYKELRDLNPALVRWCTPPNRKQTEVYLPDGFGKGFEQVYATIPDESKTSWVRHRVRGGETLSEISSRYGSSMRAIMDVPSNDLRNPNLLSRGQYLLIPVAPGGRRAPAAARASFAAEEPDVPAGRKKKVYRVRPGDTLGFIAEAHHVGLSKLLRWNRLGHRSVIRPGQRLIIYMPEHSKVDRTLLASGRDIATPDTPTPTAGASRAAPDIVPSTGSSKLQYTVQFGDTPWTIARMFGLSPEELRAANDIPAGSALMPGRSLAIPEPAQPTHEEVYQVRPGDTLWEIAARFEVSVTDLKSWNDIDNARALKPGDRLVIRSGGPS